MSSRVCAVTEDFFILGMKKKHFLNDEDVQDIDGDEQILGLLLLFYGSRSRRRQILITMLLFIFTQDFVREQLSLNTFFKNCEKLTLVFTGFIMSIDSARLGFERFKLKIKI